jgi:hypothetical protein
MKFMAEATLPLSSAIEFVSKSVDESTHNDQSFGARHLYFRLGGDGVIVRVFFEIKEGAAEEALLQILGRMVRFGLSVEGIKWNIDPVFTMQDGLKALSSSDQPL